MAEVTVDSVSNFNNPSSTESNTQDENDASVIHKSPGNLDDLNVELEISTEKLLIVLGITLAFILLLLVSLICVFYLMGLLQNVFGYSWSRPMGRTFSTIRSSCNSSSQQIAIDSNCNLYDPRAVNPSNLTPVPIQGGQPEQCYKCTAIACNGNALGYVSNGNVRSC